MTPSTMSLTVLMDRTSSSGNRNLEGVFEFEEKREYVEGVDAHFLEIGIHRDVLDRDALYGRECGNHFFCYRVSHQIHPRR